MGKLVPIKLCSYTVYIVVYCRSRKCAGNVTFHGVSYIMDDIAYSHIHVTYMSRPCALGLALHSVCNIFILQMVLVVLTIVTLLKLRWISVTD